MQCCCGVLNGSLCLNFEIFLTVQISLNSNIIIPHKVEGSSYIKNHVPSLRLSYLGLKCFSTLQMFAGIYRDFAGKSECWDFKFMGIACISAIPVILKSPHYDFHVKIVGILTLQGY